MALKRDSLVDAADRKWPVDHMRDLDTDARLWMQYLGVLSLLGRIIRLLPEGSDDAHCVTDAFVDANILMRMRGSTIRYERASGNTVGAFELEQIKPKAPARSAC